MIGSSRRRFARVAAGMLAGAWVAIVDPAGANDAPDTVTHERFSYGDKGLQWDDGTGDYFLWFGFRVQSRFSNARSEQDELPGQPIAESSELDLNRGRFKLGGHLVRPELTVYSEYDFVGSRLLDLRGTYRFSEAFSLRAGQWKSEFNRERIDSSGKQQFVERSVATPWFTVDRQRGVVASGRLAGGTRADTSYWFGWLTGAGRGGDAADADGLWLARAQWNLTGRVLGFSQSAIGRPQQPLGSIAVAAVTGRSGFTAFSSAGGGQLPGFSNGAPDQYGLDQLMLETAWQHGGFSWQQELHWKSVEDRVSGRKLKLIGGYAQAGMFFSELFEGFPKPLELALRYARVEPDRAGATNVEKEITVGANWFFNGHRNKLTLDASHVVRRQAPESDTTNRVRLQWDWSF